MSSYPLVLYCEQDDHGAALVRYGDATIAVGSALYINITLDGRAYPLRLIVKAVDPYEPALPSTLDKVMAWLEGKGLEPGRADALELMRIWHGMEEER